jgi:hypothetical protein
MKIAYVLYPDFTALDLVGPYEVISRWPEAEVHFVARSLEPVRCDVGLTVLPTDTPETLRDPDLIVVPGSGNPVPVLGPARGKEDDDPLGVPRQPPRDGRGGCWRSCRLAGEPHQRSRRVGRDRYGPRAHRTRPWPAAGRVPAAPDRVRPPTSLRLRLADQGRCEHPASRVPAPARRPAVSDGRPGERSRRDRASRSRSPRANRAPGAREVQCDLTLTDAIPPPSGAWYT